MSREDSKHSKNPDVDESEGHEKEGFRGKLESMVPDIVKRAWMSGLGTLFMTEEAIRSAVTDMRLPKEAVGYVVQQADHTKEQLYAYVAREIRESLDRMDLATELPKILAGMTIEIKAELRFVPTEETSGEPESADGSDHTVTDRTVKTELKVTDLNLKKTRKRK